MWKGCLCNVSENEEKKSESERESAARARLLTPKKKNSPPPSRLLTWAPGGLFFAHILSPSHSHLTAGAGPPPPPQSPPPSPQTGPPPGPRPGPGRTGGAGQGGRRGQRRTRPGWWCRRGRGGGGDGGRGGGDRPHAGAGALGGGLGEGGRKRAGRPGRDGEGPGKRRGERCFDKPRRHRDGQQAGFAAVAAVAAAAAIAIDPAGQLRCKEGVGQLGPGVEGGGGQVARVGGGEEAGQPAPGARAVAGCRGGDDRCARELSVTTRGTLASAAAPSSSKGRSRRVTACVPTALVAMSGSATGQASSGAPALCPVGRAPPASAPAMPALLTRAPRRSPRAARSAASAPAKAATEAGEARSSGAGAARTRASIPGRAVISATASATAAGRRPASTTVCLAEARAAAVSRPMPAFAPVTRVIIFFLVR